VSDIDKINQKTAYAKYSNTAWMDNSFSNADVSMHLQYIKNIEPFIKQNIKTALCIGDGRGAVESRYLHSLGLTTIPLDYAIDAIAIAHKAGLLANGCIEADAQQLPIKDNSVDMVYIKETLHHIINPFLTIYDAMRVSRKIVVVIEPLLTPQVVYEGDNLMFTFSEWDLIRAAGSLKWKYSAHQYLPHYSEVMHGRSNPSAKPILMSIISKDIPLNTISGFMSLEIKPWAYPQQNL